MPPLKLSVCAVIGVVSLYAWAAPAHAATLPARQLGLWQSTTNATDASGKALPGASNVISVSCVDALTDEKFFISKSSACSRVNVSGGGTVFTIDSTCTQNAQPMTIHETLTYADNQHVTLNAIYHAPSGDIDVTSTLVYQSACLPGMAAGDEGGMQNGAFSKTDNINDSDNR